MKIRNLIVTGLFLSLFGGSAWAANITSITGVSINPPNPSAGQSVTVSWTYNIDSAFNNPHVEIAVSNITTLRSAGTAGQDIVLGDGCAPTTQVAGGCAIGTNVPAGANVYSTVITIPATLAPGFTYYVIVGMKDYNVYMNPSVSVDRENFVSFSIPLPPPYINLTKSAEGTTASNLTATQVLYTIYYDAGNVTTFKITDAVNPSLAILQVYNSGSAIGQNITWNIGTIGSPQKGFVSFLAQVPAGLGVGTVINNTAIGSSVEIASSPSNNAQVAVGVPELSITKSVNLTTASIGSTLTYSLNYTNGGTTLGEYQNFDTGGIPGGWNNTGGTWSVSGGVLAGTAPSGQFPGLVDSTMTPVHDGIYVVDMLVSSLDAGYFDAVFIFNASSPTTVGNAYHARISSDANDLAFENGGSLITDQVNPNGYTILNDTWYTVKVQVCGNQYSMKTWPRGNSEPTTWAFTAVDNNYLTPGYAGFQANGGPVSFDNMKVFASIGATNPRVFDTVPSGITYQGCNSGCSNTAGLLNWNVSATCGSPQGVNWWGIVNACNAPITNTSSIDSDDAPPQVDSNAVITNILGCATNTATVTPTKTPSPTPTNSPTVTPTRTPTNSPTNTPIFTATKTPTLTNTTSPTNSPTNSPTSTATSTPTITPTPGPLVIRVIDTVSQTTAAPGDLLTYTVGLDITSGALIGGAFTLTYTLPPNITFVAFTPSYGQVYDPVARTITWWTPTASFGTGFNWRFSFQARVDANAPGGVQADLVSVTYPGQITPDTNTAPVTIIVPADIFTADKNVLDLAVDKAVTINVQYSKFPGSYNLWVYNSAGEHIKTLDTGIMTAPLNRTYEWDGTNKLGDVCASGVYILYLIEPFDRKLKRIILIH